MSGCLRISETHSLGSAGRLALQIAVASLVPAQDFVAPVVEHEVALVGGHGKHRVTLIFLVEDDGDQERFRREAQALRDTAS